MVLPQQQSDSISTPADTAPDDAFKNYSALRVLVAEDNEINQIVLREMLRPTAAKLSFVSNGKEAIDFLNDDQNLVDVVFMDMQMPVMDGIEATRIIRNTPKLRATEIIGITANVLPIHTKICLEVGMNAVVHKPYSMKDLIHILDGIGHDSSFEFAEVKDSSSSTLVVDTLRLESLRKLNEEICQSLISSFVERCGSLYESISSKFTAGNFDGVVFDAHSLKGISANLGADRLAQLCSEIEKDPKVDKIEQLQSIISVTIDAIKLISEQSNKVA